MNINYLTRKLIEEYEKWGLEMYLDKRDNICALEAKNKIILIAIKLEDPHPIIHDIKVKFRPFRPE